MSNVHKHGNLEKMDMNQAKSRFSHIQDKVTSKYEHNTVQF